jgi:hypothetical protein
MSFEQAVWVGAGPRRDDQEADYRVGVVQRSDAPEIEALRKAAYAQAAEFKWHDLEALSWSDVDDRASVLAVWGKDGRILSTVRAAVHHDVASTEAFLEYSLAGIEVALPLMVLGRAATLPAAGRQGLSAWLRTAYLRALPATPIGSVVGIVYDGMPRVRSAQASGYVLHRPAKTWDTEADAVTQPLVAVMMRSQFASAAVHAEQPLLASQAQALIDVEGIAADLTRQCRPPA